ncbi:Protein of unknown function (DUF1645) [Abeliophyllum distichum]|uniref:Calmodulin-binding protein n=1 Tax=Abeliophyllum distichum TaxID=126358 RepID=A0ABD1SU07_9LAMI
MEVMKPIHNIDFDFHSSRFSQQISTAPSSSTHLSQFYGDEFDDNPVTGGVDGDGSGAAAAFGLQVLPPMAYIKNEDDFAFDAGDESETASLTAEELFDGGLIKPLKPPRRFQRPPGEQTSQKKHFISQIQPTLPGKNTINGGFSPRDKKLAAGKRIPVHERGRETSINSYSSRTRSVSPPSKNSSSSKGHKKSWRLKDIFLFRSASEGRAAAIYQRYQDLKNSSFKAVDNPDSGTGSRRRGPVSAHELHYTINRAVSEDLKKKTFLPYKQGILGHLAFNPAVHALSNGFGLSRK